MVGRMDMWGDMVVGVLAKPDDSPRVLEYPIHIEANLYLCENRRVYKLLGGEILEEVKLHKGVAHTQKNYRRTFLNVRKLIAEMFIPNPLGLKHVKQIKEGYPSVDNLVWATFNTRDEMRRYARFVENNREERKKITNPAIEVPELITLKSRI